MELEYSDRNSKRSKLYIGAGLVIALLVGGIVFVSLQAGALGSPTAEKVVVVVAARDIPARKPIEEGDVVTREVLADPTNASAYILVEDVIGRVSSVNITTGQLITPNMLASATTGQTYSIIEAGQEYDPNGPDLRAVSLDIPDPNAVAGTLVPGQWVDLIVTLAINPELGQEAGTSASPTPTPAPGASPGEQPVAPGPSTKVTIQKLTILSRNGTIYILRADLATAEQIAELQAAGGSFTLALRPDEDDRIAETAGSTLDRLLEQFGFPIPIAPDFEALASPGPTPAP